MKLFTNYQRPLFFLVTILFFSNCYADTVLPTYSNLYFFGAATTFDEDTCGTPISSYKYSGNSPLIAAEIVADEYLPKSSYCTWKSPVYLNDSNAMPIGFYASKEDWEKIIAQNPNAEKRQNWKSDCVDDKNVVINSNQFAIDPQYLCPTGSRYDVNSTGTGMTCTTTPKYVCNADVVGRDLDSEGAGFTGHVGLAVSYYPGQLKSGNYVLEVLDNESVINVDSLTSFEHATNYWGEVYGLDGFKYMPIIDGSNAIDAGWNQAQFDPHYTVSSISQEGKYVTLSVFNEANNEWQSQQGMMYAIFRCDTFVNYCYSKGFNTTIPSLSSAILPSSTYGSFLNKRTDVPVQSSRGFPENNAKENDRYLSLDSQIDLINKDQEKSIQNKQKELWQMVEDNRSNSDNFYYLLDRMQFEKATYLITDMINEYYNQSDIKLKKVLQGAIVQAAFTNKNQVRTQDEIKQIIAAQQFFVENLHGERDPKLLKGFVMLSTSIVPKERIQKLLSEDISILLKNKNLQKSDVSFEMGINKEIEKGII